MCVCECVAGERGRQRRSERETEIDISILFQKPHKYSVARLERDTNFVFEWSSPPGTDDGSGVLGIYKLSPRADTIREGAMAVVSTQSVTVFKAASEASWPSMLAALKACMPRMECHPTFRSPSQTERSESSDDRLSRHSISRHDLLFSLTVLTGAATAKRGFSIRSRRRAI